MGFFLTHRTKAQKFRGKFRSIFRKKIRSSKKSLVQTSFCRRATLSTVRAEIITELILKRVGPVIFKTFLLELIAFRPIPAICPARGVKPENYWKR